MEKFLCHVDENLRVSFDFQRKEVVELRQLKSLPKSFELCRVIGIPSNGSIVDEQRSSVVVPEDAPESSLPWIPFRCPIKVEFEVALRGMGPLVVPRSVMFGMIAWGGHGRKSKLPAFPNAFF